MNTSIRPSKDELRDVRRAVETAVSSYEHSIELENAEIYLNWQKLERPTSFMIQEAGLILVIDPEREWRNSLERTVLTGLLHLEFMEKTDYSEVSFNWQELLKFAYVETKVNEMLDEEPRELELEIDWEDLREHLSKEVTEYNEFFYEKTGKLGGRIGQKLLEEHRLEEFPQLKRSDVIEAGRELFSE